MAVRVDLNVSLDGYATTTDGTEDNPYGEDWGRLTAAYAATRTFRSRVLGITDGSGTDEVDETYAARYFEGVGAEIMGAGMFGLHLHRDDPDWVGWWGDAPPFECPVFVLTHTPRPDVTFANGTSFHFVSGPDRDVLARAQEAAGDRDVRVGGGFGVVRSFLAAGLIDRLHVAIAPILLGDGGRLWEGLRGLERGYEVTTETAASGTVHVTFSR